MQTDQKKGRDICEPANTKTVENDILDRFMKTSETDLMFKYDTYKTAKLRRESIRKYARRHGYQISIRCREKDQGKIWIYKEEKDELTNFSFCMGSESANTNELEVLEYFLASETDVIRFEYLNSYEAMNGCDRIRKRISTAGYPFITKLLDDRVFVIKKIAG